jgi:FkbM family methyltransferase
MLNVKLTTCAPNWPWSRQTPSNSFVWEDIHFHVDRDVENCDAWVVFESLPDKQTATCPLNRTVFITGEPGTIGYYSSAFLGQFAHVVSGREDIQHVRVIRRQQGHPWFIEKSYDELIKMPPVQKQSDVCLITSDKVFTQGHRERLQFALDLKTRLGSRLDLWGRGLRNFDSSWEVLSRYRYAVVLENLIARDWLTEKLPDALLAWCVPLYLGCPNTSDYLPTGSWIDISSMDASTVTDMLIALLADPNDYECRIHALSNARRHYLNQVQFFANISHILRDIFAEPAQSAQTLNLYPQDLVPLPPLPPAPCLQQFSRVNRKLAGALRIPAWRMMKWAEELHPLPPPPPPPPPPQLPPPSLKQVAHSSWILANGDLTLRLEYPIGSKAVVLDVGGFEGQWASDIFGRYLCTVHVFEPVPHFADVIRHRFANNPNVHLHQVALGGSESKLSITIDGDASSTLLSGEYRIEVPVRRCADVISENSWTEIVLMKINIEGGEYELIEHLLDSGMVCRIRNIQIQFHDFVPNAQPRMLAIQNRLRATHELTYYFPFIWENWQRKDPRL